MPTTTETAYVQAITGYTGVNVCTNSYTPVLGQRVAATRSYTKPLPEHRTRPSSLLSNMTARSVSSSTTRSARTRGRTKYTSTCSGTSKSIYLDTDIYTTATQISFPLSPTLSPNASMAIRGQMEDDELNLGGYIGEYGETAALFTGAARSLSDMWKLAHGRIPKRFRKKYTPKSVSAAWLNSQFAVKPLVSDMSNALLNLNRKSEVFTRRFFATDSEETEVTTKSGSLATVHSYFSKSQRLIIYADKEPGHSFYDYGNPAEWIWEAIPFSFVVDWFIPIGDYINSFNAVNGWTNIRGCSITKTIAHHEFTPFYADTVSTKYMNLSDGGRTDVSIIRTPVSSIALPSVPRFKNPFSVNHVLDAVALLHLLRF